MSEGKTCPAFWHCLIQWCAALSVRIYIQIEFCLWFPVSRFLNPGSASKKPIKLEWLLLLTSTGPISLVKARQMALLNISRINTVYCCISSILVTQVSRLRHVEDSGFQVYPYFMFASTQFQFITINEERCTVNQQLNCNFLFIYINRINGRSLQFMVPSLDAISGVRKPFPDRVQHIQ
jgi:hypothetical protein